MADVVSKEKRSSMMAAVKGRGNISTEQRLKGLFREYKITGWKTNEKKLRGTPDFYFAKWKSAIFVDGCFWHGCPFCRSGVLPTSNKKYWSNKIEENKRRDIRQANYLRNKGYSVLRIRECKLKSSPESVIRKILKKIGSIKD